MILRKPYAFLIKRFKLIHFIMTILLAFISFKTANLLNFLNDYIKNGLYGIDITELISKYIPNTIFIVIGLIVLFSLIILFLMRIKNKPRLFYLLTILGYIVIMILFIVSYFNLKEVLVTVIDPRKIRITRDLLFVSSLGQYIFIAITFFRATGFNIKKFNFQEDIEELNIDVEDDEEFELTVGVDSHKLKTRLRKRIRIIKYIFKENLIAILIFLGLSIVIAGGYLILNTQVFNKVYNENDIVRINGFDIKILKAYKTDKDYRGNLIDENSNFIILNVQAKNKYKEDLMADVEKMKLVVDDKKYYVTEDYHKYFSDLEIKPFNYQDVSPEQEETFSLVYKVNKSDNKKVILEYLTNIENNKAIRIKILPRNLLKEITLEKKVSLGNKLSFTNSIYNNSNMLIKDYEIKEQYIYDYKLCVLNECNNMKDYIKASTLTNYDKTLIRLNVTYNIDSNKKLGDIIEYYGVLKYAIKGQEKIQKISIIDRTPKYYKGNNIYIEVLKEVELASNVNLILNIRDKQYIYIIK